MLSGASPSMMNPSVPVLSLGYSTYQPLDTHVFPLNTHLTYCALPSGYTFLVTNLMREEASLVELIGLVSLFLIICWIARQFDKRNERMKDLEERIYQLEKRLEELEN